MARSGRFGLADQDQDVERVELQAGEVGQLALGHPLVGRAEVLADVRLEVVDPPVEQLAEDPRRRVVVAREQADLLGRPDPVDDRLERPAGEAGQVGVLPALLHPGEGELHAADVRDDLELVLAQPVAEVAGDAVEERVAAADEDRVAAARASRTCRSAEGISASSGDLPGRDPFEEPERRRRPEDHVGLLDDPPGRLGQAGQTVVADPHDHQLAGRFAHDDRPASVRLTINRAAL